VEELMFADYATVEQVASWARDYIESHPIPDFYLGPPEDHQMDRWWVVPRNRFQNVYLHRFWRSDDDRALHDHPFDNMSWVLSGEYVEHTPDGSATRFQGETVTRVATMPHRIEIVGGPVLSLFSTGPIVREWGFHCPQGWRHWKEYVNTRDGGSTVGRGCE
jgi:hypothetical protein